MLVNRKLIGFVARHEGFVGHAYKPVAAERFWTIGYGHYGPDVKPGDVWSKRKARRLLKKDLRGFAKYVRGHVRVPLKRHEQDALISFCFNVGTGNFLGSTLLRRLNAGQNKRQVVREELPKWVHGASGPLTGLVNRRRDEIRLFTEGKYQ